MEKNSDAALMDAGGFPLMNQLTQFGWEAGASGREYEATGVNQRELSGLVVDVGSGRLVRTQAVWSGSAGPFYDRRKCGVPLFVYMFVSLFLCGCVCLCVCGGGLGGRAALTPATPLYWGKEPWYMDR